MTLSEDKLQQISERAVRRYKTSYRIAGIADSIGFATKRIGIIFGFVVAVAGFAIAPEGELKVAVIMLAIFFAAAIAIPLYVLGVLLSAVGELLLASLDQAIHGSPFLTDQQKAAAMSLE